MILGDPYKFGIIMEVVGDWNIDQTFNNGVLIFSIDGNVYPNNNIINATLNTELLWLKKRMSNIGIDERLFNLPKDEAFSEMCKLRFPDDWDTDEDYRFDISPLSFSDNNCLIFAVSNGIDIRILATSDLEYIEEDSRYNLNNIEIGETFISKDELNQIILNLNI